ncbi:calcineurin-like phosphoesterase C-terminal domain-containing protein [Sphingobacterium haloxyli]|uniref:Metallophosphoesterase n=1 Tax=Sphingobacterium haloxyli TaxID=2100533 RepID=A0A2S9J937_9SPHI|nr:calcineurin-like phosphoesterase family protein [Sphingobacterium haloxyli]PRD49315.1 metallophosphoesterase [Sphingobacterium haloxyli]
MKKQYLKYTSCRSLHLYTLFLVISFFTFSCEKTTTKPNEDEKPPEQIDKLQLTEVSIPAAFDIKKGAKAKITGKGYQANDVIALTPLDELTKSYTITVTKIEGDHIVVVFPEDLIEGRYTLVVKRGELSQTLGTTTFNYVLRTDIPDREGKNVKGVVHINGEGLANVVVSDGYNVTKTNEEGVYYLNSNKRTGYVFISIPGNYEIVSTNNNLPLFYRYLNANPNIIDTKDFELKPVDNDSHVLLSLGDMHLAARNDDLAQFHNGFLSDANQQITHYQAQGKKVYAITLGDLTWETYWYSNNFTLPEYVQQISNLKAPVFNAMGNHDNDPYFASDWLAENAYRRTLGPTYYSFNLGKVHYVILDNTEYVNIGGSTGNVGQRNYNAKIADQQLTWLEKDLAAVSSSTPIIIVTHIQLHNAPSANGNTPNYRTSNAQQLVDLLSRFNEVHVMTGHTHVNYRVPRGEKFMEHNTAAICATWWWTGRNGYSGNHISPDGSPGGYGVWEMNSTSIKWHYKSIGYENKYQFRTYDLNNVHITADKYASAANSQHKGMVPQYAFDFATENKNDEVLINIWGYDPKWNISVTENGSSLTVQRIDSRDPLHIISYAMQRLNVNAVPTFSSANTSHMFKVKASAPTTTLDIKVTDRFGNVYSETMERPKAFNYSVR